MMTTDEDVPSSDVLFVCHLILAVFVLPVMTLLRRRLFSRYFSAADRRGRFTP